MELVIDLLKVKSDELFFERRNLSKGFRWICALGVLKSNQVQSSWKLCFNNDSRNLGGT